MHNWVKAGRIILASMFILSAVSKMLSLPFFDGIVAELLIGEEYYNHAKALFYTQLLTRFLIVGELVLGVALLQNRWIKKMVLPGIMLMLVAFTIHLIYEGLQSEKGFIDGNCGCFGDILPMNNLESIIKNVVAMLIGIFIWAKFHHSEHIHFHSWVSPIVLGVVTMFTLLLTVKSYDSNIGVAVATEGNNSVDTSGSALEMEGSMSFDSVESGDNHQPTSALSNDQPPNKEVKTGTSVTPIVRLLSDLPKLSDGSSLDIQNGKTLVFMFSMTCSHCQEIYKEMCLAKDGWPRIAMLNFGREFEQTYFFNQGGCTYPHLRTEDYIQFNRWLEGDGFPRILAIEDGKIIQSWDADSYSKESLFAFYGIKESAIETDGLKLIKKDGLNDLDEKNPWD